MSSSDDKKQLFESSVVPRSDVKVKHDFGYWYLRGVSIAIGSYLAFAIIGIIINARNLPLVEYYVLNPSAAVESFGKLMLLISLSLIGAFNVHVRRQACGLLVVAHIISTAVSFWLYYAYPVNTIFPKHHDFLIQSGIIDGILLLILIVLVLVSPRAPREDREALDIELSSPASQGLRRLLTVYGIVFSLMAVAVVVIRILASPASAFGAAFGGPDPLVINMITKYGALGAISFFLSKNTGMRRFFLPVIVNILSITFAASLIYNIFGSSVIIASDGTTTTVPWVMGFHILFDGGTLALLLWMRRMQYQIDYLVTSLRPTSADCVMALHQAFRPKAENPGITAREVLRRIDEQVGDIRGRRRGMLGFPFWMIEHLFPPFAMYRPQFSTMSLEEQRWMLRRFILRPSYERSKAIVRPLAALMYQIGDAVHALITLAYYSSPFSHNEIGYVTPDARERLQSVIPTNRPPEKVLPPPYPKSLQEIAGLKPLPSEPQARKLLATAVGISRKHSDLPTDVDYCIIGSGAAGGVVAHRLGLAKGNSSTICVLERGSYYSPPKDFSDDEMKMIRMLYTEGGLQMTRTFDFTILQGECVGGTTVINNAICIQPPSITQKEWIELGIDMQSLQRHFQRVKQEINIDVLNPNAVNTNVEDVFTRGVKGYNEQYASLGALSAAQTLEGNFSNCVGCGLCNIGCRRMRKMSVLETYIPWAQASGVNVYSNVGAVQCETEGTGAKKKITAVLVRKSDGTFHRLRINKALILAGGAVASSRFLLRSNLGGEGVGKGLSCNFAFPTVVEFNQTINAFDGAQITKFAAPDSYEAIFETYFNPPGAYSISTSLYFDRHYEMMSAYTRSANFGALMGSDTSGSVSRKRTVMFGRAIEWNQTPDEIRRIKRTFATLVRIAKAAGGRRIILPTHPALSIPLDSDIDRTLAELDQTLNDANDFNFATAHPQGGNMMAAESFSNRVVDTDFRVRDCENLYLCDASVFPKSLRVNPQWTIMALASQAAERIVQA